MRAGTSSGEGGHTDKTHSVHPGPPHPRPPGVEGPAETYRAVPGPQGAPGQLPGVIATTVISRGLPAQDCQDPSPSSKTPAGHHEQDTGCGVSCLPVTSHCSLYLPSKPSSVS